MEEDELELYTSLSSILTSSSHPPCRRYCLCGLFAINLSVIAIGGVSFLSPSANLAGLVKLDKLSVAAATVNWVEGRKR